MFQEAEKSLKKFSIQKLRNGAVKGTPWDLSTEPSDFFRKGEAEGWRSELRPQQIALIEFMAGELMRKLGYPPATRRNHALQLGAAAQILLLGKMRNDVISRLISLSRRLIPRRFWFASSLVQR